MFTIWNTSHVYTYINFNRSALYGVSYGCKNMKRRSYQAFFRGKTTDTAKNVCAVFPCKWCLFWKWSLCDISVFPCTFESRTYFTCTKTYLFRKCRTVHHSTNKPMFSFIEACFIIHMDRLRAVYSGVEFNIITVDFSQLNEAIYALQRLYIYTWVGPKGCFEGSLMLHS